MKHHGLTLLELIVTISILSVILAIGIPSFNQQINQSRTKTAMLTLLDAIETTRSTAVFRNTRVTLLANNEKWNKGWTLFVDADNDGLPSDDETLISTQGNLKGIKISASSPMNTYVSFIGTGEGRKLGTSGIGGFLAGNIKICPQINDDGYKLVLSKGGRTRVERLSSADCNAVQQP